jgi:hypothetical protein
VTYRHKAVFALASLASLSVLAFAASAQATLDVAHFSVTPSTTEAGGHPNLRASVRFVEATTGLKDMALHLPAGLRANPRAIPFCTRRKLVADLCAASSRAGTITVVGVAFGIELAVSRRIYNARPNPGERLRLAVPIFGSVSRPGFVAELPVSQRPDGGLDMAVSGIPQAVNGIAVRVNEVVLSIKGVGRVRVKKRTRRRAYLTNPTACTPATSLLELTSHDAAAAKIVRTSAFTPTGCPPG